MNIDELYYVPFVLVLIVSTPKQGNYWYSANYKLVNYILILGGFRSIFKIPAIAFIFTVDLFSLVLIIDPMLALLMRLALVTSYPLRMRNEKMVHILSSAHAWPKVRSFAHAP